MSTHWLMRLWAVPAHERCVWWVGARTPHVAPSPMSPRACFGCILHCIFFFSYSPPFVKLCKQSLKLEFVAIANSKFLSDALHPAAVHNIDLYNDATPWCKHLFTRYSCLHQYQVLKYWIWQNFYFQTLSKVYHTFVKWWTIPISLVASLSQLIIGSELIQHVSFISVYHSVHLTRPITLHAWA